MNFSTGLFEKFQHLAFRMSRMNIKFVEILPVFFFCSVFEKSHACV